MVLYNRMMEMLQVTLIWMMVAGPESLCSAFVPLAGLETVSVLRCKHSISSLTAHMQTAESPRALVGNDIENHVLVSDSSRRTMVISSIAFVAGASQVATNVNADVSDGNALPEGAQQFARTIKLKTDLKVWNRSQKVMKILHFLYSQLIFVLF